MINYRELEALCQKNAPSGFEKEVREYILSEIKDLADIIRVDALGNIIALKKGEKRRKNGLAFCTAMDETALIVTGFSFKGGLFVKPLGKLQADDVICRRVLVGENKLNGILGTKPVHILKPDEKKQPISMDSLTIDIGINLDDDARKKVEVGDTACFFEPFCESNTKIMSKALERIGCFILINLMKQPLKFDTYFVFTTLSHINGAGIKTALFDLDIKNAVIVNEISQDKDNSLKGAVVPLMSKNVVYSKSLTELVKKLGKSCTLVCDTEKDLESISLNASPKSVQILRIAYPSSYPNSVLKTAKKSDIEAVLAVLGEMLECEETQ